MKLNHFKLPFLFFLFFPVLSWAQKTDTIKKLSIGLSFSPSYGYRTLHVSDLLNKTIKTLFDSVDIPSFGYSVGININYQLNKKIALSSGLVYYNEGYRTKDTAFNFATPQGPVGAAVYYYFNYLGIPLKASYYFTNTRFKIFASVGVSANILISNSQKIVYYNNTPSKEINSSDSTFSKINLAFSGAIGCSYDFTQRLYATVDVGFMRSINSIYVPSYEFEEYLYSVSLNLGLAYRFGK